jgi:hypothetical protein
MSAAGESGLRIVIAACAEGQRIAALDDTLVETIPEPLAGRACSLLRGGAAGEHGNVRIRRKETDTQALNEGSGFDPL